MVGVRGERLTHESARARSEIRPVRVELPPCTDRGREGRTSHGLRAGSTGGNPTLQE